MEPKDRNIEQNEGFPGKANQGKSKEVNMWLIAAGIALGIILAICLL